MCFVRDVVTEFHLQCRREQLAVTNSAEVVPDFDDVEVSFGRHSDSDDGFVVLFQERVGHAVNHAVNQHGMCVVGVDFLGPCAAFIIFGCVPEWTISIAHQEEHA